MKTFFLIACLAGALQLSAQSSEPARPVKSLSIDIGGPSLLTAIQYDQRFTGSHGFGFRTGLGWTPSTINSENIIAVPFIVNWLSGKKSNSLEMGAGFTLFSNNKAPKLFLLDFRDGIVGQAVLGYRYERQTKHGFLFRFYANPIITSTHFLPWAGISFGARL